jgi:hypothetical protein
LELIFTKVVNKMVNKYGEKKPHLQHQQNTIPLYTRDYDLKNFRNFRISSPGGTTNEKVKPLINR